MNVTSFEVWLIFYHSNDKDSTDIFAHNKTITVIVLWVNVSLTVNFFESFVHHCSENTYHLLKNFRNLTMYFNRWPSEQIWDEMLRRRHTLSHSVQIKTHSSELPTNAITYSRPNAALFGLVNRTSSFLMWSVMKIGNLTLCDFYSSRIF